MQKRTLRSETGRLVAATLVLLTVACAQTDPGITTAVTMRFATDDLVKAYNINVDTRDGVVTLSGAVESTAAKDRAVQIARQTEGVRNVTDMLTVNPAATVGTRAEEAARDAAQRAGEAVGRAADATADASLTTKVKTGLLADEIVRGLRIDVDSNDGVVTLTGTVRTAAERQRALDVARRTEGVTRVVDKLIVG